MPTELHTFGDPDYIKVPAAALMNKEYLIHRMLNFDSLKATSSTAIREGENLLIKESEETTHYSMWTQPEIQLPERLH